ncbi:putative bifunctional diguanylate cyclase/phosphodiesterase [Teredinibacter sp. KSP-S5-2]|uniref:putative bifunctional diguanylate cyclase/phosphodiesterase n=1 Tax=Teredinibacter sp. KSP-S5-2 TaxID=3034506 RepID=UPI002934B19E|nr:EAL domain-containing protein [Teredinibacter sp. KSP-S5-2]WNO09843.1 EAL domain-containing protein [Teredinibacter sp. KSP-S5-2]
MSNNRELQELLDAMHSVVLYMDRWGVIKHGNQKAIEHWSPLDGIEGKSFLEIAVHWDDPSERQREIMQVIRTGTPAWGVREREVNLGVERWFQVDKVPTAEDDGRITGVLLLMTDITENVVRERALRESESRYRAFIANSADAIWRYDVCPPVDTRLPPEEQAELIIKRAILVECNERLARLFDASHINDLLGLPIHRNGSLSTKKDILVFVQGGYRLEDREFTRINRHGERNCLQSSATGIIENGFLTRAWGTTRDITDQKRYIDRMEYLATHDSLTTLPNRTLLYRRIDEALVNRKEKQKMALMLIDLDRFKEINDTLGHAAGDKVLKLLGPRLEAELGDTPGTVARLGGDEFAIFLPNIRNTQQAAVLGHRFLDCICQIFEVEGYRTEISASIGISLCPDQACDVSTMMKYADVAMYQAKTTMKGVAIYDSSFDPHSPKRLELMGALGIAIREGQLLLHFQPKINLKNHQIYGFEALVRWNHPEMGFVPPTDFVPIAERSNLIYPLTLWVLENSIKQCAKWRSMGMDISVAMNLSARNVTDDRLITDLAKLLQEYRLPGEYLEMEITESTLMSDPNRALIQLRRINALGVVLAIDDFGTGYSSLAYLKRLPVQSLKIDRSFIFNMLCDEQDEIIVNSTVNLAHNLGLSVVAEGVECMETYDRLEKLSCDSAQGYYIARPMSENEICDWLESSSWEIPKLDMPN